jgi:hypothetical protein
MIRQLSFRAHQVVKRWVILVGAVNLVVLAISGAGAEETGAIRQLAVKLETPESDVQEFDPLFVKVTVTNPDDQPVITRSKFSFEEWTIALEMRRRGEQAFKRIATEGFCALNTPGEQRVQIRPGKSVVAFGLRIDHVDSRLFSGPGDYEFRARVADVKEYGGTSAPVSVRVRAASDEKREAIEHANQILSSALTFSGIDSSVRPKDVAEAIAVIPQTELRGTLDWIRQIAEVRDATSAKALSTNLTALRNERKKFSPIVREWITRTLAEQLIALGQWKLAEEEIDLLSDNSEAKSELAYKLLERRRNAARRNGQGTLD